MKKNENQIIRGIKEGRESSYNQLFQKYYIVLSVFATKYVGDIETAKEIVQDFFIHLYEIRNTLLITTSLESYLYQSVRNRCLNHIKQIQTRERHFEKLKQTKESQTNIEEKIGEAELETKILQLVRELPSQCQKIFRLSRVEEKKNQEIAELLNISKRTVETQISKALKILRGKLKEYLRS